MEAAGLYVVQDMESRTEPHCVLRVFVDPEKARQAEQEAKLLSRPLVEPPQVPRVEATLDRDGRSPDATAEGTQGRAT